MTKLHGWWRILIVVFIGAFIAATAFAFGNRSTDAVLAGQNECVPGTVQTWTTSELSMNISEAYDRTPPEMLAKGRVIDHRQDVQHFSCVSWTVLLGHWASVLAFILAVFILIHLGRWIGRGFEK